MKLNNHKMLPDLRLKDGSTAYHCTFESNQGTVMHQVYWSRKLRREPIDLTEEEFTVWSAENAAE